MPYSRHRSSSYGRRGHARAVWAWLAGALVAVWLLAAWLEPSPSGVGTHERLGLPPCGFRALTQLPCPACGLTTAFALLARFQPVGAWRAQPLGVLLAGASVGWLALCVYGWSRRLDPTEALHRWHARRQLAGVLWLALGIWVLRLVGGFS